MSICQLETKNMMNICQLETKLVTAIWGVVTMLQLPQTVNLITNIVAHKYTYKTQTCSQSNSILKCENSTPLAYVHYITQFIDFVHPKAIFTKVLSSDQTFLWMWTCLKIKNFNIYKSTLCSFVFRLSLHQFLVLEKLPWMSNTSIGRYTECRVHWLP